MMKSILCTFGYHLWNGCICTRKSCSTKRDAFHEWSGCICFKCNIRRDSDHSWEGCICAQCGKKRDKEHSWEGCVCSKCGKGRDKEHSWKICICTKCNQTRHNYVRGYCINCGNENSDLVILRKELEDLQEYLRSGWVGFEGGALDTGSSGIVPPQPSKEEVERRINKIIEEMNKILDN